MTIFEQYGPWVAIIETGDVENGRAEATRLVKVKEQAHGWSLPLK